MKNNKLKHGTFALLTIVFFSTGCQKLIDYVKKPGNGKDYSDICQVKTVNSDGGDWGADYVFNYNKRGNLESIITSFPTDGNPNVFIFYDKKQRPTQIIYPYRSNPTEPGPVDGWETFGYNSAGQIVRDTSYTFGAIGAGGAPDPSSALIKKISTIQYDGYDRVVGQKDSVFYYGIFNNTNLWAYKYDANGNLAYSARQYHSNELGGTTYNDTIRVMFPYDNKINIRQTNRLWMFLDKNYSVNNSLSGASYNLYGLPLVFDAQQYTLGFNTLLPFVTGKVTVQYDCK
ncbi:hypothetical protein [Pinibacter aurantiacus]|uniref:DUF4595 domain-containing protein n=1 Tax=Pinibacter aurantiacus TaxID=2851599 RepID=A0A9E2S969_9BACT|nr:hypothetical protein [Pinibacter aurantiacus]MBV4358823.1 hypothetical protein [Pinibacter aurantiacus]